MNVIEELLLFHRIITVSQNKYISIRLPLHVAMMMPLCLTQAQATDNKDATYAKASLVKHGKPALNIISAMERRVL